MAHERTPLAAGASGGAYDGLSTSSTEERVMVAAWYIDDAQSGVEKAKPADSPTARWAYGLSLKLHGARQAVVIGLILLSFFELPSWCASNGKCSEAWYPTAGWYVGRELGLALEAACALFLVFDCLLAATYTGSAATMGGSRKLQGTAAMVAVIVIDLLVAFAMGERRFRATDYARLGLYVLHHDRTRETIDLIVRIVPEFVDVSILTTIFLFFFAWFGTVLFHGSAEGTQYFPTLWEAANSLLILLTTANYPDVMMPSYGENRLSFVFFGVFLLVGLFFLCNLVLATVYNNYVKEQEEREKRLAALRQQQLRKAFAVLDAQSQGWIDFDTMEVLFRELNRFQGVRYIEDVEMQALFTALDTSGDQRVDSDEFDEMLGVFEHTFEQTDAENWIELNWGALYRAEWFQAMSRAVKGRGFELSIDVLLFLNGVSIACETAKAARGEDTSGWETVETWFTVLYFAEMILKILANGPATYWESYQNRFDALVTWVTALAGLWIYLPNGFDNHSLLRNLLMVRLLRLWRLIGNVPRFRVICHTFVTMLPRSATLMSVMFCCMYLFAIVGVQIFGGAICNPTLEGSPCAESLAPLAETTFGTSNYWANNLNDYTSAFVTLFELLVVNNWFVIMDGFVSATGTTATRWYFYIFWVVGVNVGLNIVTGFVLDTFISEWEESSGDGQKESSEEEGAGDGKAKREAA